MTKKKEYETMLFTVFYINEDVITTSGGEVVNSTVGAWNDENDDVIESFWK